MKNLFKSGYKKCENCGKIRKNYPDFESQWTAVEIESVFLFYCPHCWGIPDPAAVHCKKHGHDIEHGQCQRCGFIPRQPDDIPF